MLNCAINSAARKTFFLIWDHIGIAWTCHYRLLRSVNGWTEMHPGSLTAVVTCVWEGIFESSRFLLLPGLQVQPWRPHLCLHSTTEAVGLTEGILILGWYWVRCSDTHWSDCFFYPSTWSIGPCNNIQQSLWGLSRTRFVEKGPYLFCTPHKSVSQPS